MINYFRHNFRRHQRSGQPRISVLDNPQLLKCPSDFFSPFNGLISGFSSKFVGFDNFFWNPNPLNVLKKDLSENEIVSLKDGVYVFKFGRQLVKYFSKSDALDNSYINGINEKYKFAVNNVSFDSIDWEDRSKHRKSSPIFKIFIPHLLKCSDNSDCKKLRSRNSESSLSNKLLKVSKPSSENRSRSFTTLSTKSTASNSIDFGSLNTPRSIQRPSCNFKLFEDNGKESSNIDEVKINRIYFSSQLNVSNLTPSFDSFIPEPCLMSGSKHEQDQEYKKPPSLSINQRRRELLKFPNLISENSNRSITTLSAKPALSKATDSSDQRSVDNAIFAMKGQESIKSLEKVLTADFEKLKKKDFDWLNSFSSEAVLLQPSRGEFSIKKLINKTACQERLWGLPPRHNYSKTAGPRMNDNVIHYTALKHKIQSESRKNNFFSESIGTSQKIKKLIKSAKEKNKQSELKRMKKKLNKPKSTFSMKSLLNSMKSSINLQPLKVLKTKQEDTQTIEEKNIKNLHNKKTFINFKQPTNASKERQNNLLPTDKPKPSPTEYQSSASYKHVFQDIFNRSHKAKSSPKAPLEFFNRQQSIRTSHTAIKPSIVKAEKKGKSLKNPKPITTLPERNSKVNLKNSARTPFQKPSNSQLTSKSKASFSTVSKIPKKIVPRATNLDELMKTSINTASSPKVNTSERRHSCDTNIKLKENEETIPMIKKTLYSTLGYYPAAPNTRPKIKPKTVKIDGKYIHNSLTMGEEKSQAHLGNYDSGYFNQRRSLSSLGLPVETSTVVDKLILKEGTKTDSIAAPLNEQVFKEVMNLCKKETPNKKSSSKKENIIDKYGRCSVEEKKKPERRRGFVCRLASMLNIGCSRRRTPYQGCKKDCGCGKNAG